MVIMVKLSIVIPTYNRLNRLKMVLESLARQDYPMKDVEVVVVSDGSTDGTEAYLKSLRPPFRLETIFQQNQGVATARNQGYQCAQGEIILFIDDDVVPSPQLVREHLLVHANHGDRVVVLGTMLTPEGYAMTPWVQWEQQMLEKQYRAMQENLYSPTCRQFFTGNTSLARKHLVRAGGFDPNFRRAEDVELAYRLNDMGLEFVFHPQAAGFHYAERSFASWSTIAYVYGKNDVIFSMDKGQNWLLPQIFSEYYSRHPFTRLVTRLCLDRPRLSQAMTASLKLLIEVFHRLKLRPLVSAACSAIFNLRYYQGLADQLGGGEAFWSGVQQSTCRTARLGEPMPYQDATGAENNV